MVSAASAVRVDECIFNLGRQVLSDLFVVRHTLWLRAAEVQPLAAPKQLMDALAAKGMDISQGHHAAVAARATSAGWPTGRRRPPM